MGRESLQKQKAEGLKQKLCCLVLDDPNTIVFGSEPIRHEGQVVSWVTSGGYGYSVNKSIAYGYLPIELAKAGTRLTVECFGIEFPASVEKEPLFDPRGEKIKA
jgi:4-methylaminobutanoate oxidase (formaldehyde-forming)